MTIVKIQVNKVHAERNLDAKAGQVQINSNVSLKSVDAMELHAEGKKGLKFAFNFTCNYQPDIGKIDVDGQVFYVGESAAVDEIQKQWSTEKKISQELMEKIVNAALHKGNIQAIKISEDVNLPTPLPLPKVKTKQT